MLSKNQIEESVAYLHKLGFDQPEVGIVLGTGLGNIIDEVMDPIIAHYSAIPSFPLSTVEFHSGKLIFGTLAGKKVVIMQGRFHLYEGYDFNHITYPIRVMHSLGIKHLLISNAAGAINAQFNKGELMLIEDHINLQAGSPLAFKRVAEFGPRFVDMSAPYNDLMNQKLIAIADAKNIILHQGVYAAVIGPQLETRAEYRMLKIIGADAVGMSTVPEVVVANHLKLPVAAISVLTDECDPDHLKPVNIQEIIEIAEKAQPKLTSLFKEWIRSC
ncbi:MAG: purine-nucleoside phosphorylase [Flavobacteriaceae bacterium]|nr:purine-nucleoside phosphorylase [Flavobacteriaceae bacterium]